MKSSEIHSPIDIFFRVFPPTAGALLASLIALVFFTLYNNIPGMGDQALLEFSGFVLFGVTFLSALLANVIAVVFLSLANPDLYGMYFRRSVTHIFFVTVVLFALCSPLYLIFPIEVGFTLTQFLMPFAAIAAALIFEICTLPDNPLRATYKGIFSGIVIVLITLLLFNPSVIPEGMMPFFLMPIAWFVMPLTSLVVGVLADVVEEMFPKA